MITAQQTVMLARRAPADEGMLRTACGAQLVAMTQYERA